VLAGKGMMSGAEMAYREGYWWSHFECKLKDRE
jgi:hypothetical protein